MARTLSDTLIIAMIEAATRLAGGRGPVAGAGGAGGMAAASSPSQMPQVGGAAPTGTGAAVATAGDGGSSGGSTGGMPSGAGSAGGEHDSRSADQIAADFRTIYSTIEDMVKKSAEEESKAVGFAPR